MYTENRFIFKLLIHDPENYNGWRKTKKKHTKIGFLVKIKITLKIENKYVKLVVNTKQSIHKVGYIQFCCYNRLRILN